MVLWLVPDIEALAVIVVGAQPLWMAVLLNFVDFFGSLSLWIVVLPSTSSTSSIALAKSVAGVVGRCFPIS